MKREKIINLCKYLFAFVSLLLVIFALREVYISFTIPKRYWLCVIALILFYLLSVCFVLKIVKDKFKNFIFCIGFHIIPIIISCLVFLYIPHKTKTQDSNITIASIELIEKNFNDIQKTQIKAAVKNGITPLKSRKSANKALPKLIKNKKLVKISSNKRYFVRNLTHSIPYVVPEADSLITDIAKSFQEMSKSNSRFEITSVLRTKEDIIKLMGNNPLAVKNSCHAYGTTFDISYVNFRHDRFHPRSNKELRKCLATTLRKLQKEGRCYVKKEKNQKCYHITVR